MTMETHTFRWPYGPDAEEARREVRCELSYSPADRVGRRGVGTEHPDGRWILWCTIGSIPHVTGDEAICLPLPRKREVHGRLVLALDHWRRLPAWVDDEDVLPSRFDWRTDYQYTDLRKRDGGPVSDRERETVADACLATVGEVTPDLLELAGGAYWRRQADLARERARKAEAEADALDETASAFTLELPAVLS